MPADYARLCSILNLTQAFKERKKEEKKKAPTLSTVWPLGVTNVLGNADRLPAMFGKRAKWGNDCRRLVFFVDSWYSLTFYWCFFIFCIQIFEQILQQYSDSCYWIPVRLTISPGVLVRFWCEENKRQGHNFWLVLFCHSKNWLRKYRWNVLADWLQVWNQMHWFLFCIVLEPSIWYLTFKS